ncbi:anthranilate synthase component II [Polluticoccus soli]|uniref:anthranilate synthase component II n=1 Tax=Polluticoccus soli TaxID=3034150 RepID=UPI0023E2B020|nr:aminodeoxychorismate/anthranilate synthase component II [Flavipsychrobacter sp. JY13-12]
MWILLDNYDSFTYILHHYLLQTGNECVVYRNDELSLQQLIDLNPSRLIISPGPETPIEAGICMDAIAHFHDKIPILGVCLGHQALGMFFGAKLVHAKHPMHGKTSEVTHNGHPLFQGVSSPFTVMRYHSLAIEELDETGLQSIAQTDDGTIMAFVHERHQCTGIQFHPESIGTPDGMQLLINWAVL